MLEAIQGEFAKYGLSSTITKSNGRYNINSEEKPTESIVITGKTLKRRFFQYEGTTITSKYTETKPAEIYTSPERGMFCIGGENGYKYYVLKNGDIKDEVGTVYTANKPAQSSKPTSTAEDAESVLKITVSNVETSGEYTTCEGTIKNTGKKTYKFVEVKGAFKSDYFTVVDTDWTYAVGSEGLAPGESSTFKMSVPANEDINSCDVSLLDYEIAR